MSAGRAAVVEADAEGDLGLARPAQESTLAEGLRIEKQAFAATFALDDQSVGMGAFRDKRTPEFTHS